MSDTPETDKCVETSKHIKGIQESHWISEGIVTFENPVVDLCRRLERERDEALEQNAKLREIAEKAQSICERWVAPEYADAGGVKQLRAELDQIMEGGE